MLLSAFNELKAKMYIIFQDQSEQDESHIGSRSPTLGTVEFQLEDVFIAIFTLNMDGKPNMVELFILGPSMARMVLSTMARQRMVGKNVKPQETVGERKLLDCGQSRPEF